MAGRVAGHFLFHAWREAGPAQEPRKAYSARSCSALGEYHVRFAPTRKPFIAADSFRQSVSAARKTRAKRSISSVVASDTTQ